MNQEQRFIQVIVHQLDETAEKLTPEIKSSLADARQQAVIRMAAQANGHQSLGSGLVALCSSYFFQHQRILSLAALIVAVLLAFIVTQQLTGHGHAEHGDAFLLASELPPEAYLDQGFYSWLKQQ